MIFDYDTLKVIWWAFVAALLIGFALTDGYDMGAGILLPFIGETDEERRVIINVLAPHWDGNQVWLITGAAALFAAWPLVYAAGFSTFYLVLLATLYSLLLRPGAFEYRSKIAHRRWRRAWDWALFAGSLIPAFIFGAAFGNLLLGVPFTLDDTLRSTFHGTYLGQLHPFALLTGVVGVATLAVHGATYLGLRTRGELHRRAAVSARLSSIVLIAAFAVAGLWLAFGIEGYRIVSMPPANTGFSPLEKVVEPATGAWLANYVRVPWTLAAPAAGFLGALGVILTAGRGKGRLAVSLSSLAATGVILTVGISLFPFIMPSSAEPNASLTVWDATSSYLTLTVMFWVVVVFLPIVLAYTFWAFRKMWRPIDEETIRTESDNLY